MARAATTAAGARVGFGSLLAKLEAKTGYRPHGDDFLIPHDMTFRQWCESLAAKGDVGWLTPGDPVRLFPAPGAGTATPATPAAAASIAAVVLQVGAAGKEATPLLVAVPPAEAERARDWLIQDTAVMPVYGLPDRQCP